LLETITVLFQSGYKCADILNGMDLVMMQLNFFTSCPNFGVLVRLEDTFASADCVLSNNNGTRGSVKSAAPNGGGPVTMKITTEVMHLTQASANILVSEALMRKAVTTAVFPGFHFNVTGSTSKLISSTITPSVAATPSVAPTPFPGAVVWRP